jgi:hypothetical protein
VAEDEGDALIGTEVGEPVPVEDALAGDDQLRGRSRRGPVSVSKKLLPAAAFGGLRANRPRPCGARKLDFGWERRGAGELADGGRFSNF